MAISPLALTYGRAPGDGAVYQTPVNGAVTKRIPGAGSPYGELGTPGDGAGVAAGTAPRAACWTTLGLASRTTRPPDSTSSSSSGPLTRMGASRSTAARILAWSSGPAPASAGRSSGGASCGGSCSLTRPHPSGAG